MDMSDPEQNRKKAVQNWKADGTDLAPQGKWRVSAASEEVGTEAAENFSMSPPFVRGLLSSARFPWNSAHW